MVEYTLSNSSILNNGEKIAEITRETTGSRTSSIVITGTPSFLISRDEKGSFNISKNGVDIGKAYRGLRIDCEGQIFEVQGRELSMFPTGMSNSVHVLSGGMTIGTINRTATGLTASSDFNPDVMLIYLAFLAPYASSKSVPMRYYGNYRSPMPSSYRRLSMVLGLGALAFLGIGAEIATKFMGQLYLFAGFCILSILSYIIRIIGRKKYQRVNLAQ